MARVYMGSVFEGKGERDGTLEQRKRVVAVAPGAAQELVLAAIGKMKSVISEPLGPIQLHSSKTNLDVKMGTAFVLTDTRQTSPEADRTGYGQPPRLETVVANIAILASMGLEGGAVQPVHRTSLDRGMPVLFPGAVKLSPDTPPEAGALVPFPVS